MGKDTFVDKLKRIANSIGWRLVLWGLGMSQEHYWKLIYEQEKRHREEYEK